MKKKNIFETRRSLLRTL